MSRQENLKLQIKKYESFESQLNHHKTAQEKSLKILIH